MEVTPPRRSPRARRRSAGHPTRVWPTASGTNRLLVHGGYSPIEALRAATVVPARAMKVADRTASIAAGKAADLVIVDGDPLVSISDVRRTVMTFRSGVLYPSKELYETVGVAPW